MKICLSSDNKQICLAFLRLGVFKFTFNVTFVEYAEAVFVIFLLGGQSVVLSSRMKKLRLHQSQSTPM